MKLAKRSLMLAAVLILPMIFAGAHPAQRASGQIDEITNRQKISGDFLNALNVARDNYAGKLDLDKLTKASVNGMLRTLDPHSMYFDPKQWEEFQNDQRSRYYGIGSTIIEHNGKVYIWSPTDKTPSYNAGMRYGDHIIEVNGESTVGLNVTQVRSKLLGPEGTPVRIKVMRAGIAQPVEVKINRGAVPLPSVSNYFMLDSGVGYVNLDRGFNTTTFNEVSRAIEELRSLGMTSLVLDLRNNGGGLVDQAWRVTNLFLSRGQKILSMRGRAATFPTRDFVASNPNPDDYPVIVLINRGSASASEIVAGALQDHDRAVIVGENSFGKGLVQNPFPLSDRSALILTTGHYYTPSGRLIQREYTGQSFYDYYLKRGDKEAINRVDERRTDSGRLVYGGGGIQPDVEVKRIVAPKEIELQRVWFDPVFQFVRDLVGGQVQGLASLKLDRPADHSHRLQPEEYLVDDKLLAAFKNFLRQHPDLKTDAARVDKDAAFIRRQMRYELVTAAFGLEKAYQVLLEADNQLQAAVNELPKARVMAEAVRRNRASEPRRND
ncbi:MAG TPA: S41 family peptidase [Blastocatellia bacterium]